MNAPDRHHIGPRPHPGGAVASTLELAYLGLKVPDPASLTPFFADVIGLVPGTAAPGPAVTWRNDDKAHRIIVEPGPANDAAFVGFEVSDDRAFDAMAERLGAHGFTPRAGTDEELAARRVKRLLHTTAPWGVRIEIVEGLGTAASPFTSPLAPGRFLTAGVGFGHVVFATTAFEHAHHFAVDALGMAQSDWLETEIGDGVRLEVRFYHCNERHHSLALARAPFELPQSLHHVMVELNSRDDVGVAFDRAWEAGLEIPHGLGRHDNDGMFSFYVRSPAGFLVEVGFGARTIHENWDDNRRYSRISAWGHQELR